MDNDYFYDADLLCKEDGKRLARMLSLSRAESGLSQEKVSMELGIAKKTVQNWEKGVSTPTLPQAVAWFRIMNVSALPYFLQFMFPDLEGINSRASDSQIRQSLDSLIDTLPIEGVRQLMYILYGDHGSSPRAVLNTFTAYLQLPLKERYMIDTMVLNNYRLAKDLDKVGSPDHIQPNEDVLDKAIAKERQAILNTKDSYMMLD